MQQLSVGLSDGQSVCVHVVLVVPLVLLLVAGAALVAARAPRAMLRLAPLALLHINLVLALYAGAGLATAARLKWDPSTYIAVREMFPAEYRVAAAVLAAGSFALLLLVHLSAAPLCTAPRSSLTRLLYILYASAMCSLLALEVAWAVWTGRSIAAWLHSEQAAKMMELAELREHIQPILQILAKYHPLPDKISALIEEAEADAPRNMYVAASMALLLAVLQPAAVVVAVFAACRTAPSTSPSPSRPPDSDAHDGWSNSATRSESESAPLTAKFKNGKLVMV